LEGWWMCSWWTTSSNYTFINLLRMKNHRLPVQF
jgi:hypothetical protein